MSGLPASSCLLALETSTPRISVALLRAGGITQIERTGDQASRALLPMVQTLLQTTGTRREDLQAIVFGAGPGMFTGLRAGASAAQGLAYGLGIGVIAIDSLMQIAQAAFDISGAERVLATQDARMGQVYWAQYERDAAGIWRAPAGLHLGDLSAVAAPGLFTPSAALAARLALAQGEILSPADAQPLYIRERVAQTLAERRAA